MIFLLIIGVVCIGILFGIFITSLDAATSENAYIAFIGLLAAVCLICGVKLKTIGTFQTEAIEANVAEWSIDPITGEKEFIFLSPVVTVESN